MRRLLAAASFLALATACGGGSTPAAPSASPSPSPSPAAQTGYGGAIDRARDAADQLNQQQKDRETQTGGNPYP